MAKKVEKEKEDMVEKQAKPFQKFLLIVLIPLLFAITAGLIVATAAGVNVFGQAKTLTEKIPVAGSLFQKENAQSVNNNRQNVNELKSQLKDREAQISQLQESLNSKDSEIQKAQLDNSKLQQEISDLNTSNSESKRNLKDIVTTYETMDPKKAAPIIAKMSDSEALEILTKVKPEVLAAMMENFDPAEAARFTELMTNNTDSTSNTDNTNNNSSGENQSSNQ